MNRQKILTYFFVILIISAIINAKSISPLDEGQIENYEEPGFWRRQLIRAGSAASSVSNAFGKTAVRLSAAMDKICHVVKKIIPIVGAICTVGQFKFCALENIEETVLDGADSFAGRALQSTSDKNAENKTVGYVPIDLNEPD